MKQCPSCKTKYTDDTLSYCLADGTRLDAPAGEQQTQLRSGSPAFADQTVAFGDGAKLRIDVVTDAKQATPIPNSAAIPINSSGRGGLLKILALLAALLFLGLLAVGTVGLVVYLTVPPSANVAVNKNATVTPVPTVSPRGANDKDELRDQIANLQKQLDEQKTTKGGSSVPLVLPKTSGTTRNAKANSPRDGFLALRSLPNSEIGDRVAKIPHGAAVTIGACGPVVRSVSRSGRWCQAEYGGMSGWVFDAYLSY